MYERDGRGGTGDVVVISTAFRRRATACLAHQAARAERCNRARETGLGHFQELRSFAVRPPLTARLIHSARTFALRYRQCQGLPGFYFYRQPEAIAGATRFDEHHPDVAHHGNARLSHFGGQREYQLQSCCARLFSLAKCRRLYSVKALIWSSA